MMDKTITSITVDGLPFTLCKYSEVTHVSMSGRATKEGNCYISPDHAILIRIEGEVPSIKLEDVVVREFDENGGYEQGNEITLYDLEGNRL